MNCEKSPSGPARRVLGVCGGFCLLLCLAGCGGSGGSSGESAAARAASSGPVGVNAADFHSGHEVGSERAASEPPAPSPVSTAPAASPESKTAATKSGKTVEPLTVQSSVATEGLRDVAVLVGDPKGTVQEGAKASEGAVTIDALVGQINGKPIYADKFFAPLDAAMRADRAKAPNSEIFLRRARDVMYSRLKQILIDELLTAEARAELSPEQRQGLFYFVNQVRDTLASQYGGSREVAEQNLRDKEGRGFEAQVEEEKRRALQQSVLRKYVVPHVNVSWRDVLRAYEKEYSEAASKSTALVRMVWMDAKDTDAIKEMNEGVAAGTPFLKLSEHPKNQFPKGDQGVIKCEFKGDYATAKLLDDEALNKLAQGLSKGAVAGPLDYKTASRKDVKVWMTLEDLLRPQPTPLDDVQLRLYNDLSMRKRAEEQEKFFLRLIERASFSPLTDMLERLLLIAAERYPGPAPKLNK